MTISAKAVLPVPGGSGEDTIALVIHDSIHILSQGEALETMRKLNKSLGFVGPEWGNDDVRWQQR